MGSIDPIEQVLDVCLPRIRAGVMPGSVKAINPGRIGTLEKLR